MICTLSAQVIFNLFMVENGILFFLMQPCKHPEQITHMLPFPAMIMSLFSRKMQQSLDIYSQRTARNVV